MKRLELLKQMEEDIPEEKHKIEEQILALMDIEQADELNEVFNYLTESNLQV
jgi:hypothetical protein